MASKEIRTIEELFVSELISLRKENASLRESLASALREKDGLSRDVAKFMEGISVKTASGGGDFVYTDGSKLFDYKHGYESDKGAAERIAFAVAHGAKDERRPDGGDSGKEE